MGASVKPLVPGTPFPKDTKDRIPCYDPGTLEMLGPDMHAMTAAEVRERIARAKVAQKEWGKSSFKQRRMLMKILQRFILENQDTICQVVPGKYPPPRHPTHFKPSFLEEHGILRHGE
jgi:acyl-CoA reductase-like NAD-dependent aldehyde dehydrogenase